MHDLLMWPFELPPLACALLFAACGGVLTLPVAKRAFAACGEPDLGWSFRTALCGALLSGLFTWWFLHANCQQTPMVRPEDSLWWFWRIGYHVILISLMLAATATDIRSYLIPDIVAVTGLVLGIGLATISGQLQIQHIWIDWNQQIPQLSPPYVPDWVDAYRHWHGLASSLAGAAVGAGGILLVRSVSSSVLGQETMGLGDVTLMGMIGSYLGWQPVTFVLILAPLCALTWQLASAAVRAAARRIRGRRDAPSAPNFIPYGPFLCAAAYLVLMSWRWIWMFDPDDRVTTFTVRGLFGDWLGLLIVIGGTIAGFTALLVLRRAYLAIPVTRRTGTIAKPSPPKPKADSTCSAEYPADGCTQHTDHAPPTGAPPSESRASGPDR